MAAGSGEDHPIDVEYVVTTQQAAEVWLYGSASSGGKERGVIAFAASGDFNAALVKAPSFAMPGYATIAKPRGATVMTAVMPIDSSAIIDWGLGTTRPDLTRLGTVVKA